MEKAVGNREAVERVVHDHAGWVFAAAKRRVKDATLAEDVTQAVFLLYWRKGVGITHDGKRAGWLYRAVRYCSANALRLRNMRERHEREAAMERQRDGGSAGWSEVEAELEGAVDRLSEQDRRAVVLRFYRSLSLKEVGEVMGLGEEAARKRVARAVGKLREKLAAQGVEIQVGSLAGLISEHAVQSGSVELAGKTMAGIADGIGNSTAEGIAKGVVMMAALARVKAAVIVVVVTTLAVAVGVAAQRPSERAVAGEVSLPPLQGSVMVAGAEKEALLEEVLRLRTATRAAVTSGRGIAHLETAEERSPQLGAPNPPLPNHEVRFAFRGNDSLVTGGAAFNATALLVTDSKVIRYYAGTPGHPAPPAVSVLPPDSIVLGADLPRWSFKEMSRLPRSLSAGEVEPGLFADMAKMPEARVERSGPIVRVTVVPPRHESVLSDTHVLEFDLERGGMLTRYHWERAMNRDGWREETRQDWRVSWAIEKGIIVPSGRAVIHEVYIDGKFSQRYATKISFDSFSVEDIPAEYVSVQQMGIRPGTPGLDTASSNDWRHLPDGGR